MNLKTPQDDKRPRCNGCFYYWFKKLDPWCFYHDRRIRNIKAIACKVYLDRYEKVLKRGGHNQTAERGGDG